MESWCWREHCQWWKKYVVPKRHLHKILSEAHSSTCHWGRDKTERYLQMSYNGISQQVVNLFISLCKLHQQQSSITSHYNKTISTPNQASGFLCHVEMDLIDFRKLPCNCSKDHSWVLDVEDHFSKYSWLLPLKVVLYPKNRIFCALGRFFENAIKGHFNHSFTLFPGVFGEKKMSYQERICQKIVICPIFCLRNALSNGCLHSLFQNFEGARTLS